jgi:parafibromin
MVKEAEIIMHKKENGQTIQFKVIDNIARMAPQDWDRVVAVFTIGKQWQFKDWPIGNANPTEIFSKVKGFHLKMSDMPLDPNVARWSVSVVELDPHKRHLDRARLLTLWDELNR